MRRAWLGVALGLAVLAPGAAEAAVVGNRFDVRVGTGCANGFVAPDTAVTVTLRAPDGRRLARRTVRSDATTGSFQACLGVAITAGRTLVMTLPGGGSRSLAVPPFTMVLDRVADAVSGIAPSGSAIGGNVYECVPLLCAPATPFDAMAGGDARWSAAVSPRDITGGDLAQAMFIGPALDTLRISAIAPYLAVRTGGPASVRIWPPRTGRVTLRLRGPDGRLRATATGRARRGQALTVTFRRNGRIVRIRAGDRVTTTALADADVRVPSLALRTDAANDTVAGRCFPGSPFTITLEPPTGEPSISYGIAGGDGRFTHQAGSLGRRWRVTVDCEDARGDRVRLQGTVR